MEHSPIDYKSQKWNIPLIKDIFLPYDNKIFQISLDDQDKNDFIMWMNNK